MSNYDDPKYADLPYTYEDVLEIEQVRGKPYSRLRATIRALDEARAAVAGVAAHQRADRAEADAASLTREFNSMSGWRDAAMVERDAALAAVAQLRAALKGLLSGMIRTHGDEHDGETLYSARIADVANAVNALASTTLGANWVSPEQLRGVAERAWELGAKAGQTGFVNHPMQAVDIDALLREVTP